MLHSENKRVRELLFKGYFGLEKENLRVTPYGEFSHEPHPFGEDKYIDRDFCENQIEINTGLNPGAREAVEELYRHTVRVQKTLSQMKEPELLWPFSNPSYIKNERDIPIARYEGERQWKTAYREHLAERYGKYKMTLSGVHLNYSFAQELLEEDFKLSGYDDFRKYKDDLYIMTAKKAAVYGWLLTALTAASPVTDSSYMEKGVRDGNVFYGMASVRCSENGYWNGFTAVIDYSDICGYAASIERYVEYGWLKAASEFYYPVRLKPAGTTDMKLLSKNGADHIELRMFDLDPFEPAGINVTDVRFAQLFLIWIACTEDIPFSVNDQIAAVQNFKNAARYDLMTVNIHMPDMKTCTVLEAGLELLDRMKNFYRGYPVEIQEILDYEEEKLGDPGKRYSRRIRREFGNGFVKKGLKLAEFQQKEAIRHSVDTNEE